MKSFRIIGGHELSGSVKPQGAKNEALQVISAILLTDKKITIKNINSKIEIEFRSKSFLRNQVRSMVGCLKYLAEKKWNIKKFENVLKSKKRKNCAPPAPACGLYLEKVIY